MASDHCYWTVVDVAHLPRPWRWRVPGPGHARLACLMESVLPVPLESLQFAFAHCGRHRYVGCAVPRELAEQAAARAGCVSLRPAGVPAWLDAAVVPARLELLGGEVVPARVRACRRRASRVARWGVVAAVIVTGAICERRRIEAIESAAVASLALEAIADRCLPVPRGPWSATETVREIAAARAHLEAAARSDPAGHPEPAPQVLDLLAQVAPPGTMPPGARLERVDAADGTVRLTILCADGPSEGAVRDALLDGLPGGATARAERADDGVRVIVRYAGGEGSR